MYVGRPNGEAWLSPAGPTAVDEVEFNRDHPLAPNVVAYWAARGGVLQDMLGTIGDMIADNSGVAEGALSGLSFGNLGVTNRACYAPYDAAWKPTAATTIIGQFAAPPGGASGTFLFGTENSLDGWGCYSFATGTPRMYMRVGAAWADQGVSGSISREPSLIGMSHDGATFTARWDGSKSTQSISGSITQSSFSLDIPNRGGNAAPNGGSAALCLQFIILDRALSDAEWDSLRDAPWQLLRMVRRPTIKPQTNANYPLTVDPLAYEHTLADVGLSSSRTLSVSPLAYAHTLADVGLEYHQISYTLDVEPLAYRYRVANVELVYQPVSDGDTHDGFVRRSRRQRALDAAERRRREAMAQEAVALRLSLEAAMGIAAEVAEEAPQEAAEAVQVVAKRAARLVPTLAEEAPDAAVLATARETVAALRAAVEEAERARALAEDDEEVLMLLRAL